MRLTINLFKEDFERLKVYGFDVKLKDFASDYTYKCSIKVSTIDDLTLIKDLLEGVYLKLEIRNSGANELEVWAMYPEDL